MVTIGILAQRLTRLVGYILIAALLSTTALATAETSALPGANATTVMHAEVAPVAYATRWHWWHGFEDQAVGWRCARNGNRICGPRNPEGAPAGCYRNGRLVLPWAQMTNWRPTGPRDAPC